MMDMQQFGRKISELRNKQKMTQMELADKMNVTFQAVSNWERGNTMPDASRLVELADILQVTMDELCGRNKGILNSAATGCLDEYMRENSIEAEELCDAAPLLKGEQVEQIAQEIKKIDFDEISKLLPHLSDNMLTKLVRRALEYEDHYENIICALPFLPEEIICEIAYKMIEKNQGLGIIAPFIPENRREVIARKAFEKGGKDAIWDMLPFIPDQAMKEIVLMLYDSKGMDGVEDMLTLIPRETLEEIALKEMQEKGLEKICHIAPFLDNQFLAKLAKKSVSLYGMDSIECIKFFLGQSVLDDLVGEQFL